MDYCSKAANRVINMQTSACLFVVYCMFLQERERQERVPQIKRLYSHPSNLNTLDQLVPHQQLYPTP